MLGQEPLPPITSSIELFLQEEASSLFGGDWNLVNRLVIQAFSSPVDDDLNSTDPFGDRTNGLGDTIFFSLFAPDRDDGFIWGVGPTFILPTATEDVLGQEKWQAGPAALAGANRMKNYPGTILIRGCAFTPNVFVPGSMRPIEK